MNDNMGVILINDNIGVNQRAEIGREWPGCDRKKGESRIASSKSEAVADLMLEVAQFFFRIRAVGQKTGLITGWGGGAFGFMRSLALLGPLTVPQIAEMRPTSRQRMQRLADELAAEGLVEFVDNPKHRRSKLVQLTAEGRGALPGVEQPDSWRSDRRWASTSAKRTSAGPPRSYGG